MVIGYGAAVALLYRAPIDQFVAERKRLSSELKSAGDKDNAGRLLKLPRPPLSAWAVNQLWWQARETFEQLLSAAERLRGGDLGAGVAHREALARLRSRAAALLAEHGHSAPDSTLRRITATLSALAANGGFAPDLPGALGADREPPGFDVAAIQTPAARDASPDAHGSEAQAHGEDELAKRREQARAEAQRRELEAAEARQKAEERRREEERARRAAARKQLEAELSEARARVQAQTLERERLRAALTQADEALARARGAVQELETRLAGLDPHDRLG